MDLADCLYHRNFSFSCGKYLYYDGNDLMCCMFNIWMYILV